MDIKIIKLYKMAKRMKQRRRLDLLATMQPEAAKKFKLLLKETGYHVEDDAEQPHEKKI